MVCRVVFGVVCGVVCDVVRLRGVVCGVVCGGVCGVVCGVWCVVWCGGARCAACGVVCGVWCDARCGGWRHTEKKSGGQTSRKAPRGAGAPAVGQALGRVCKNDKGWRYMNVGELGKNSSTLLQPYSRMAPEYFFAREAVKKTIFPGLDFLDSERLGSGGGNRWRSVGPGSTD